MASFQQSKRFDNKRCSVEVRRGNFIENMTVFLLLKSGRKYSHTNSSIFAMTPIMQDVHLTAGAWAACGLNQAKVILKILSISTENVILPTELGLHYNFRLKLLSPLGHFVRKQFFCRMVISPHFVALDYCNRLWSKWSTNMVITFTSLRSWRRSPDGWWIVLNLSRFPLLQIPWLNFCTCESDFLLNMASFILLLC